MTEPKPRRRADAERNIAAIVEAASKLFSDAPDISMTEVAKAAGVGRVTLYAHFPSREELVEAVVDRVIDEAAALLTAAEDTTVPADVALTQLARTAWQMIHRHERLRVVAVDVLGEQRLRARHDRAGLSDQLNALIARGQDEGTIRTDLPAAWLIAIYYSVMHTAAAEVEAAWVSPDDVQGIIESTLRPLFAPVTPR